MIIKRKIGPKGQIVIPEDIRKLLGIIEGSTVIFEILDGKIVLKSEKTPEDSIKEFLNIGKKLTKKIDLKNTIGEQIEERLV